MFSIRPIAVLICTGLAGFGCSSSGTSAVSAACDGCDGCAGSSSAQLVSAAAESEAGNIAVAEIMPSKAATTQPSMNAVKGSIRFTPTASGVRVTGEISGLVPGSKHGFHIHEKGDLSGADLMTTGAHWDPHGTHLHGGPTTSPVHGGDMGNLEADANGVAKVDMELSGITIDGERGVVGRAVIVHAKEDDLKSQPSGAAGARVAGGLIVEPKK